MRLPAGAAVVVGVLLIGAFASPESRDNTRDNRAVSLFGLAVMYVGTDVQLKDVPVAKRLVQNHGVVGNLEGSESYQMAHRHSWHGK